MLTRILLGGLLASLVAWTGCKPAPAPSALSSASVAPTKATEPGAPTHAPAGKPADSGEPDTGPVFHLAHAQTNLPKVRLHVGPRQVVAEACVTVAQVATGLMHRESIGPEESMFFIFGTPQQRSFYMKNVKFPIAAAYIDADGVVDEIVHLKAMDVSPVPSKSSHIQYVLETAPDWFERNGITKGALVTTPNGTLEKTVARFAQLQ